MVKTSQKSDAFLHHQRQSIDDALGLLKLVPLDGLIHCKLLDFGPEVPSGEKMEGQVSVEGLYAEVGPQASYMATTWNRLSTVTDP